MSEKRLSLRRRWRSKIILEDEFGAGLIYLFSKDISLGGLLLEQVPPIKLGSQLFLSFVLPGEKRPIRLTGQVVRFVEHAEEDFSKTTSEAGVRFLDLEGQTLKRLSEFIQQQKMGG